MEFRYGISARSLARWSAFDRICAIQRTRGPDIGWAAMSQIVDAELKAIGRATEECEAREGELLRRTGRSRVMIASTFRTRPRQEP